MRRKPVPETIEGHGRHKLICHTYLDHRHRFTGKTKQIVDGELMGPMSGLAICQAGESEFYLFGCDADWNVITDTWHQSLAAAQHQAEYEYEGVSKTWKFSVSA